MEALAEDALRPALEALDDGELEDLLLFVTGGLRDVEEAKGRTFDLVPPKGLDKLAGEMSNDLNALVKKVEKGTITQKQFDKQAHDLVSTNFRKAYEKGRGQPLDAGDEEWLSRAAAEELGYARKFGAQAAADELRMPRGQRAEMYGQTLGGIATHAQVESLPDDARIDWVLGVAEHCEDCLMLAANSPYTKWNLPTTPRAGATVCLSKCKCKLRVKTGALSKEELADAAEYEFRKDQSLSEMMERPDPPEGLRWPNEAEQRHVDNLRKKINTNRRLIASGDLDGKELKAAIRARREANDALIDFMEKNDVYDVPVWGVEDVLDERDIGRQAVKDIFRHGLDGKSLDKVSQKKLSALLDRYEREVGETFSEDALAAALKAE